MKPNTRLLIRFSFADGSMKSWGYDYPHYESLEAIKTSVLADFADMPDHTEVHVFYYNHDSVLTITDAQDLADQVADWIKNTGDYNGN